MFLKQALDAGNGEAAEFVALMFAAGMVGEQNWNTAFDYLAHAASRGWTPALQQLLLLANHTEPLEKGDLSQIDCKALREQIDLDSLLKVPLQQSLCAAPRIVKLDDFLPNRFCDWVVETAKPALARARIYDDKVAGGKESEDRTNSSMSFDLLDLDLILLLIQSRIAKVANAPLFAMEKSMVLHYKVGEEFRVHHDYLDPNKAAHAEDMRQFGQRLATCLIYLNNDFEGAETYFPKIEKKFRCKKGGALLFINVGPDGQPDPDTLHAGLPPVSGEKWLFSQWIRSGPQQPTA